MDSATAHTDEFLRNAEEIMGSLLRDLDEWKNDPYNRHLIDRIFRYMHSLKSGAAFLEMTTLESLAHSLESLFDSYRKGAETDEETIEKIMKAVSIMNRELDRLMEEELPPLIEFSSEREEQSEEERPVRKRDLFSPFEKELLSEASRRGEKLYRIICHLDEFPQMLYARAYLLMNNLELSVNVITTDPPMDDRQADFTRFTAYITTDLDVSGIYKAVNVDSIVRVDLIRLDYASYLEREDDVINLNFDEGKTHPTGSWIRVEQRKVDELAGYIDQLKVATGRFSSYRTKMDDLHQLARGMERVLLNVTMVPLNTLLKGFPRFVEELCRKTGKSAELLMSGESCAVDRTVFDIISETLQHLIRNAVYHGLESFDERRAAGKSESGSLVIHTEMADERIHITLSDDGRGINRRAVLERASRLGLKDSGEGDLLSILAKPGFSTVEEADSLSGRGVGLDLVIHNIQDKLKGEIHLINDEGKGVTYKIVIPTSRVMTKILLMRSGGRTMAFPARNVESTEPFSAHSLIGDRDDFLFYRFKEEELPLFTESGRLHKVSAGSEGGYVLIVTYLGLKAAIYTEELLMEKEILSDNLRLNEEAEPFLYQAVLSGEDCLYLSPSIISI
ncbi:chemotaxis protein CheA [Spirochaeta isovalerica]|uniref:Chemotaxis protein CheA n=1 Tax=Spirochaeta isovalerica TaxID=150 RepID=A0A841REW9_9SPIO|nr:ATP-binding protein [Spirochaeta isovalerica]MBB6481931.1 two-component system chemotaxis sensor kinase CheA [Spirochaeta isovalerica]